MQSYPVFVTRTSRYVIWVDGFDQEAAVERAGNDTWERLPDDEALVASDLTVAAPGDEWDWATVYDGGDVYPGLLCDAHVEAHRAHLWQLERAALAAECAAADHPHHRRTTGNGRVECTLCQVTLVEAPDSTVYLVWSNDAGSWWGPNGRAYTGDVWAAGRFTRDEAVKACGMRTWSPGAPPPEVMVEAPENNRPSFTITDLRALPGLMQRRIATATAAAAAARDNATVAA